MTTHSIPQATSPLSVWLDYLSTIHTSAIDLGLERVEKVAQHAKLTKPAPVVITVAGTNGKGSTCAIIEAILIDAGYRVGVYSSPHLIQYSERVRINGAELDDDEHSQAFAAIEKQRQTISLSFFEFGTLAALWLFKQHKVDVVLLEVGLGGRLDATNVVDHDVSIITSLAVDHVDWLGSDINVIGYEKAGIYRSGRPAICGQPKPPATVVAHADEIGAEFFQVGIQYTYQDNGDTWQWQSGAYELTELPKPNLPLANAATALMALGVSGLELSDLNIIKGMQNVELKGRMQVLSQLPLILLDVAHNPHSASYLVEQLQTQYRGKTIHAVIGMLHDKDIEETINVLLPAINQWYPASLQGPRAATADELSKYIPDEHNHYSDPVSAFQAAKDNADDQDIIVVVGSFHTVGEVLHHWQDQGEM
ncbi:bifunctional tetrahydrofolate synthase/dihydrofolate synthase [Vibrio sp. WJH972]